MPRDQSVELFDPDHQITGRSGNHRVKAAGQRGNVACDADICGPCDFALGKAGKAADVIDNGVQIARDHKVQIVAQTVKLQIARHICASACQGQIADLEGGVFDIAHVKLAGGICTDSLRKVAVCEFQTFGLHVKGTCQLTQGRPVTARQGARTVDPQQAGRKGRAIQPDDFDTGRPVIAGVRVVKNIQIGTVKACHLARKRQFDLAAFRCCNIAGQGHAAWPEIGTKCGRACDVDRVRRDRQIVQIKRTALEPCAGHFQRKVFAEKLAAFRFQKGADVARDISRKRRAWFTIVIGQQSDGSADPVLSVGGQANVGGKVRKRAFAVDIQRN